MKYFYALILILFSISAQALQVDETAFDGHKIWYSKNNQNPIISLKIAFKNSGYAHDPEEKLGLAYFVAAMLNEGADDIKSEEFMQRLEDNSIGFAADVDADNFYVSIKTLSRNADTALELLNLALTKPNFEAQDFERVKEQLLTGLKKKQESAQDVAGDELAKLVFAGHDYAKIKEGSAESLNKITPEDLHKFVAEHFAKDNFSIAIAGDVNEASAQEITQRIMAGLVEKSQTSDIAKFEKFPANADVNIDKDFAQTVVVFAKLGIDRHDKDFYAAYLLNHILGGGDFQSRLYHEVREKRGLTYYSWSGLQSYSAANLLIGSVATEASKKDESIAVIKQEIAKLAEKGVTQAELDAARSYVIGAYPFSLDSSAAIAAHLLSLQLDNLPIDYPNKRDEMFAAVTLAQVNALAKSWLGDDKLVFLSVGKLAKMQDEAPQAAPTTVPAAAEDAAAQKTAE